MNVAIFTDNDFAKVNGVTTSLRAVLRYAPDGIRPRIYTASEFGEERPQYLALRSLGVRIPFYGEMRMYWPRLWRYLSQARRDRIDAIHLTTPGPVGLAALFVASRAGLPMVGSFHTDLAACAGRLSGSARLGTLMREYMRWTYGRCSRVLAPSENTRTLLIEAKIPADRIGVWRRGVDARMFSPARRSVALRERWGAGGRRPILLYVGRISKEKGLDLLPALQTALHRRGSAHRLVLVGDGPLRPTLERALPDAIFMGSQSPAGVADAMASADLFVFPSDTDSAGNVVLEAQSCGLPGTRLLGGRAPRIHPGRTDGDRLPGGGCREFRTRSRAAAERSGQAPRDGREGSRARVDAHMGSGAGAALRRLSRRLGAGGAHRVARCRGACRRKRCGGLTWRRRSAASEEVR